MITDTQTSDARGIMALTVDNGYDKQQNGKTPDTENPLRISRNIIFFNNDVLWAREVHLNQVCCTET
jgi:hypothetical protein